MSESNLKQLGLRVTRPRLQILRYFLSHPIGLHVSADDIFKVFKTKKVEISLATIYRVLTQFETAGILKRLNLGKEHAVYELNRSDHHDHMICVHCNSIHEFIDPIIEKQQTHIVEQFSGRLVDHTSVLYIECQNCLKKIK